MQKTESSRRTWLTPAAGCTGYIVQGGCSAFLIGELEVLFAPGSPGNALFVLDRILFSILAPLLN